MIRRVWVSRFIIPFFLFGLLLMVESTQSAQSFYITGKVQSASSGKPIPSLWVVIYDGETQKGRSLTGDDGMYLISALDNQGYKIVVRRGNKTLFEQMVRLPENEHYDIRVSE